MNTDQIFSGLLSQVYPFLKQHGFTRRRYTFYLLLEGNWGLVNFQRSNSKKKSTSIVFTVNIGVASRRLLEFFSPPGSSQKQIIKKPDIWECHWRIRLGELLGQTQGDLWWTIAEDTDPEQISQQFIAHIRDLILPQLQAHITDEALRDLWLKGWAPSLTEFQRLMYLSVLLRALGPVNMLEPILHDLQQISKDRPNEYIAKSHSKGLLQAE